MKDDLDQLVADLRAKGVKGVSRSSVARSLLQKALGNDAVRSEVHETLVAVWMSVQKAFSRIMNRIEGELPAYLDESYLELAEKSGEPPSVDPE